MKGEGGEIKALFICIPYFYFDFISSFLKILGIMMVNKNRHLIYECVKW